MICIRSYRQSAGFTVQIAQASSPIRLFFSNFHYDVILGATKNLGDQQAKCKYCKATPSCNTSEQESQYANDHVNN